MSKNEKMSVVAILNGVGIVLLVLALFVLFNGMVRLGSVLLSVSIACQIPDNLVFLFRVVKREDSLSLYWISKFVGLVMCFLLVLAVIVEYV